MRIAFFGSSLVSAYWNGAATYYRGIIRALARRGHNITFYEPDAFDRQRHRDIDDPSWAQVAVYPASERAALENLERARECDLIVKASGVGVLDDFLERAVLDVKTSRNSIVFWDVDAPSTLDRVRANARDPFRQLIPRYTAIFTYGGGDPVVNAYRSLGARACVPVYNAVDPETHHPASPDPRFEGELGFLGNRLPDRESRVEEFFLKPAQLLPGSRFVLGGAGWEDKPMPENVRRVGHVYSRDHNAFNATPLAVINIARDSMARYGYSPATRIFEAAGAAACVITDEWDGIGFFFEPVREILVAAKGEDVVSHLETLSPRDAARIGLEARRRVLSQHTYHHRAQAVEQALEGRTLTAGGV